MEQLWESIEPPVTSDEPGAQVFGARTKAMAKQKSTAGAGDSSSITAEVAAGQATAGQVTAGEATAAPDFSFKNELTIDVEEFIAAWDLAQGVFKEVALDEKWPEAG